MVTRQPLSSQRSALTVTLDSTAVSEAQTLLLACAMLAITALENPLHRVQRVPVETSVLKVATVSKVHLRKSSAWVASTIY